MKFDSIILDIDGTIWNTTSIVANAWNLAIDFTGYDAQKVNPEMLKKEFGKTMDVIAEDLWPSLPKESRQELLRECCVQEQHAVKENDIDITYPGVVQTVKELSDIVDFYIVSNCQSGYIELMLEKTGLKTYIKDFSCFGYNGKPKSENIRLIIERNNLKKPVYIGDTHGDKESCEQAGIPFIWAEYGFGKVENAFAKLSQFSDLKNIL